VYVADDMVVRGHAWRVAFSLVFVGFVELQRGVVE
jgi:hypothetical protein